MTRPTAALVSAGLLIGALSCSNGQSRPAGSPPTTTASPAAPNEQAVEAVGGCAATHVYVGSSPPTWAQVGFRVQPGQTWTLPWASAESGGALAYLFATELVAMGERPDGVSNKILWVTRDPTIQLQISAHPAGHANPAIPIRGQITNLNQMPSQVDLPSSGCWSFELSWGHALAKKDRINVQVLPVGTAPPAH